MTHRPMFAALVAFTVLGGLSLAAAQERETQNQSARPPAKDAAHEHADLKHELALPKHGVAVLRPTEGNKVRGVIRLDERDGGLHIQGRVNGLTPGKHGFHIHEFGDLRDPKGESAGGHFEGEGHKHGAPGADEHHAGDLGNIEANEDGVAMVDIRAPWLKLHFVLGRSMVVHADADDLTSQPSGAAGPRVSVGVIGIAQAPQPKAKKAPAEKKTN